jgi:hypothetical protein
MVSLFGSLFIPIPRLSTFVIVSDRTRLFGAHAAAERCSDYRILKDVLNSQIVLSGIENSRLYHDLRHVVGFKLRSEKGCFDQSSLNFRSAPYIRRRSHATHETCDPFNFHIFLIK